MTYFKTTVFSLIAALCIFFTIPKLMTAEGKVIGATKEDLDRTATAATVTVDLWPDGKMPGRGASDPETEMPSRGDNVQRITNISRPTLSLFPAAKKNAPALIVCPGGGYSYVTYNKEGTEIAEWLNSAGITALVLKYRVPNNREGALQDIQRALSLAREHAAEWNIDPERLGAIGFSAGGNLVAKASNLFDERTYTTIDSVDKRSCRPDFVILVYPAYLEKDGQIAADLNLKAKIPPTLIVHTEDDKNFINGSKVYQTALVKEKVPNEFLLYATGGHGYGLHSTKDASVWPQAALDWLRKIGIPIDKKNTPLPSATPAPKVAPSPAKV